MKWQVRRGNEVWPILRYSPINSLEELRKVTNNNVNHQTVAVRRINTPSVAVKMVQGSSLQSV
jgi:hypothetical protein